MPIYHHWENVSNRLITALGRVDSVHHFNTPVDPAVCIDYKDIIKNPMDFTKIKQKLKTHTYKNMRQFIEDVELVFDNCRLYNGEASWISEICKKVQEEFLKQCELLNIKFYIIDIDIENQDYEENL